MRKILFFSVAILLAFNLPAQSEVKRVFILNEGYYDYVSGEIVTPVTLAAYDPATESYSVLDEIEGARFASDVEVYGDNYFVAADKYLIKYDINTDEILNTIEIEGIRKIAIDDNYIVVTRGEYLVSLTSYIQVYDKNTMEFIFEIPAADLNYATEGVLIKDGIAYVAVNNGFDFGSEVGYIEKIDLASHTIISGVDLGEDGKNPDNIMLEGDNIYTLNNKDYTGSSVSAYNIVSGDISTSNLINISAGCGTSALFNGNIYYQESFGTSLSKYDPLSQTLLGEKDFGLSFYGMTFDDINNLLYVSETDYFSMGKIYVYDVAGILQHSFSTGISPGNIAFDVRTTVSIPAINEIAVSILPNPAADIVHINAAEQISEMRISDINGNVISVVRNIYNANMDYDISSLSQGNYFISIVTDNTVISKMIAKI